VHVHDTKQPIEPVYRTNRQYYANNMELKNIKCDEIQNCYYYGRWNVYLAVDLNVNNMMVGFLISNFSCVLNVVCFILGNSPASEFYMPTFRNILSVPSS